MGGTCAVTLAVKYPELFSTFLDIDGDLFPNAGTREQSIARLFGGDEAAFDSVRSDVEHPGHGPYTGMSGWFSIVDSAPPVYRPAGTDPSAAPPLGPAPDPRDHSAAANYLCELGSRYGIECSVAAEQTEPRLAGRGEGARRGAAVAGGQDRLAGGAGGADARRPGRG